MIFIQNFLEIIGVVFFIFISLPVVIGKEFASANQIAGRTENIGLALFRVRVFEISLSILIKLVEMSQHWSGKLLFLQFLLGTVDVQLPQMIGLGQNQATQFIKSFETPNVHTTVKRGGRKGVFVLDHFDRTDQVVVTGETVQQIEIVWGETDDGVFALRRFRHKRTRFFWEI